MMQYVNLTNTCKHLYCTGWIMLMMQWSMQCSMDGAVLGPLIDRFVKMYVNPTTVEMGKSGEESIRRMFEMAKGKGLVPDFDLRIAAP